MARKLYVGNLPYDTAEQDLQSLVAAAGTVDSVNVMRDMATGDPGIQNRRFSPSTIICPPSVQPGMTRSSGKDVGSPRRSELSNISPSVVQPV